MNLGLKLEDVREEVLNLLGHGLEGRSRRTWRAGEVKALPARKSGKSTDSFAVT